MFLRNNKQKFSIRKLSAGAASVLVATSVLGGTTVKANSEVSRTATPRLSRDLKNRLSEIAIDRDASSAQKVRNLLKGASVGDLQALLRGLDSARAAYGRVEMIITTY
ncbi:YSIRK-type signal peptide-containing protein [Streptococcus equi]|uniref:YSIRK-type signal peptide-containing protein n=1 Tax=Streptococcus equi TaxID=1336 RepID=UPI0025468D64|nr:YSIRK-type signal peptide-containing protein [Streptococcus equi]